MLVLSYAGVHVGVESPQAALLQEQVHGKAWIWRYNVSGASKIAAKKSAESNMNKEDFRFVPVTESIEIPVPKNCTFAEEQAARRRIQSQA